MKQALEVHEESAELTIWLASIAAIFRSVLLYFKKYSGILKSLALVLFFVTVLSIARTGFYGGELVYKHAAGVQLNLGFDFNDDTTIDNE